jgi:hypothetical protein
MVLCEHFPLWTETSWSIPSRHRTPVNLWCTTGVFWKNPSTVSDPAGEPHSKDAIRVYSTQVPCRPVRLDEKYAGSAYRANTRYPDIAQLKAIREYSELARSFLIYHEPEWTYAKLCERSSHSANPAVDITGNSFNPWIRDLDLLCSTAITGKIMNISPISWAMTSVSILCRHQVLHRSRIRMEQVSLPALRVNAWFDIEEPLYNEFAQISELANVGPGSQSSREFQTSTFETFFVCLFSKVIGCRNYNWP